MTFHVGDNVIVKHQRELASGYTVAGYVRISNDNNNNKLLGYHPENLEVV